MFEEISNDELSQIINKWIKGKREREILKMRLIDKIKFDDIAEEVGLSSRQVKYIYYKSIEILKNQATEM